MVFALDGSFEYHAKGIIALNIASWMSFSGSSEVWVIIKQIEAFHDFSCGLRNYTEFSKKSYLSI